MGFLYLGPDNYLINNNIFITTQWGFYSRRAGLEGGVLIRMMVSGVLVVVVNLG